MTQELLDRKWRNFFGHFDADGNGYLERDDFVLRGTQVAAACGFDANSAKAGAVTDGFQRVWNSIVEQLDTDGDGRISRDEFTTGMAAFADDEGYEQFFQPAIDALLVMADHDGDGRIGLAEWLQLQGGYGTPRVEAERAFELLDADRNGYLTRAEISTATRQYFTSTDPAAPGNHLYGTIA